MVIKVLINILNLYHSRLNVSCLLQFPYPPPQANEPTKTLKCLVNIRKESLRLVRAIGGGKGDGDVIKPSIFNLEFTFDCDARTAITIYYFATEEFTPNGVV